MKGLLVLDMDLPVASGRECLAAARSVRPDIPAILMSGLDYERIAERAPVVVDTRNALKGVAFLLLFWDKPEAEDAPEQSSEEAA